MLMKLLLVVGSLRGLEDHLFKFDWKHVNFHERLIYINRFNNIKNYFHRRLSNIVGRLTV